MNIEQELKNKANALISAIRFSDLLNKAEAELNCLMDIANYTQRAYDKPSENKAFQEMRDIFQDAVAKSKQIYGNDVIKECYLCFKSVLNDTELMLKLFGAEALPEGKTFDEIYQIVFDKAKENISSMKDDVDGFTYWSGIVSEVLCPIEDASKQEDNAIFCPYCGELAQKQPSALYIQGDCNEPFVWGCSCGAYAFSNSAGEIVGTLADSALHKKRMLLRKAVSELCDLDGITLYESYRIFSRVIEKNLKRMNDIEYLSMDECNKGLSFFLSHKTEKKKDNAIYPTSQKELMSFLQNGGRLRILQTISGKSVGRLLIPITVGDGVVVVRAKKSPEQFRFPKTLQYEFRKNSFTIIHPSGQKERYQMYFQSKLTQ